MARKEQKGRQESKSRLAMRAPKAAPASATPETVKAAPTAPRGKQKVRSGCIVAACACAHEYQDERYGQGKRVFNLGPRDAHCTVCGAKRSL